MAEERVRVLLLDDEESLRVPLKDYLERNFGYQVDAVATGEEALVYVEQAQGRYDVALIDDILVRPPDGIEVMEQIKGRYPHIECIIFTGWGTRSRERALRAGAFRYLEKPFDVDELGILVRTAAQQVRLREISQAILSVRELGSVLESIAGAACSLALADEAAIVLADPATGELRVYYSSGKEQWRRPFRNQDLNREVMATGRAVWVSNTEEDERVNPALPIAGIRSFAGVPIPGEGGNLGVLYVYSRQPGRFDDGSTMTVLQILAGQAGLAIANARAFEERQKTANRLRAAYEASKEITSTLDPDQVLQTIVEKICKVMDAWQASVILIDEAGRPLHLVSVGFEQATEHAPSIYPDSISMKVVSSGQPHFISDTAVESNEVHSKMIEQGVKAAACLPLEHRGRHIGVLWIHYAESHAFSEAEKEALRLYASQAAIAIDNARRVRELEQMRQAAEAMSRTFEPRQALQQIVESAALVLGADSAIIWSYDEARDIFLPEGLVTIGIPAEELETFREEEPKPGRTAYTVMRQGYMPVADITRPEYEFLGPSTRELLDRIGVRSFQGIALRVGDERLGVLYANYKHLRSFGEEEERRLRTFAGHAALALKNARLLAQMKRTREAAGVIAAVTLQERLGQTLAIIARHTQQILHSDAVTIYAYDEKTGRFDDWAVEIRDRRKPDSTRPPEEIGPQSVAWSILNLDAPPYHRLAEDRAAEDALLGGRFAREEEIQAAIGIQLRVGERKVGVMFVEFRSPHRFTDDEIQTIRLFASQAAVAIRNARLYREVAQRMETLQVLYEAGRAITEALTLQEVLDRIVIQARHLVGGPDEEGCSSHLALVEGHILYFAAACAPKILAGLRDKVGDIDLKRSPRIGITGRAVKTGQSQNVDDVEGDPDYICFNPHTRSELAVPIRFGGQVIGVINVEHPRRHAFSESDQKALESLAAQAAVAIRNARQSELQQAIYDASKIISAGITRERRELLNRILEQAVVRICWPQQRKAHLGVIQLYDPNAQEISLESVYPPDQFPQLVERLGEKWSLDRTKAPRIGIGGRTVLAGAAQRVDDVRHDPDYVEFHPATLSELDVPLRIGDRILGVLSLESNRLAAFDEMDEAALQSLADLAAIVIENARQYEEFRRTKGIVGARTALAWMGMASSAWRHAIDRYAVTIRDLSQLLRGEMRKPSPRLSYILEKLDAVERLANQILERPMVPPLSREEGIEPVALNDLVGERARQLWKNEPYKTAELQLDLQLPSEATVLVSPEWLRRAFDILVDNAVEAVANSKERIITIGTRMANGGAEIWVSDTGPGITEEIRSKIGLEPIEKPEDLKGLGMGLLMAQTIVQTYDGELRVGATGPTGTTMVIWLPLMAAW